MTLTDTGPLYALLDADQTANHARCVAAVSALPLPLITTLPCFTEAMYLVGRKLGYRGQEALWEMYAQGQLAIHECSAVERRRMRSLMAQYQDTPMDLADASLVAAAETLRTRRIFTLDSHFFAFRLASSDAFEVTP